MDTIEKKYYKIREVAEMLGLPPSTLRFWESKFTLVKPRRNQGGTRFYTPRDIEILKLIFYLVKDKGLKLEAAEAEIRRNRTGVTRRYQAIERLRDIRTQLTGLLKALDDKKL